MLGVDGYGDGDCVIIQRQGVRVSDFVEAHQYYGLEGRPAQMRFQKGVCERNGGSNGGIS